jgi:hypothetical protein
MLGSGFLDSCYHSLQMRILFYAAGATGSGHVVRGLIIAAALKRSGVPHHFSILSADIPYIDLARRLQVPISTLPGESEEMHDREHYRHSALFAAIDAFKPDILLVDQIWVGVSSYIRDLPCKKVMLTFQMDPSFFHIRTRLSEYRFRPEDYDLLLRTEPGYEVPFDSREINPMVLRNRDEIVSRKAAREDLKLSEEARVCLFACSGRSEQVTAAWKSFSYLEDEGWKAVRSHHREGGLFPTVDWFNAFELLIYGAGYCAFWEARWFKKEAFFVPLPRRFENQARRPALFSDYEFEKNGADELVGMLTQL